MVIKAQKSHGARSELNSVFGLGKVYRWNPIRTSATQSISRLMRFLGFSSHENGAPRQDISKSSTVCSTFSRSGWSVGRSASLAKGDISKKRPSPHLHKIPTRSNKMRPRTFQTTLIILPSHPRLSLPSEPLLSGFSTKILYAFLTSPMRSVLHAHFILLDFITNNLR
jgi:hypothetical protein